MQKEIKNYCIFIFFILYIQVIQADKSKILAGKQQKLSIMCIETEDCTHKLGLGYECTDHVCNCDKEELCGKHIIAPKISSIVNVIDEHCNNNDDCKVSNSFCIDDYCRCEAGKVASLDKRKCLPIAGGLNETCEQDIQCMSKEPNSICRYEKCVCNDIHNLDKFSCVPKVALGGKCNLSSECSHIPMSTCGLIYCECEQGFVKSENKENCLAITRKLDDVCEESVQCRHLYGTRAICRRNKCECDGVHTLVNDLTCPSKLKTFCDTNDECKMYIDDSSLHCYLDRCECSPLYIEADGVCNGGNFSTVSWLLLTIILLFMFTDN